MNNGSFILNDKKRFKGKRLKKLDCYKFKSKKNEKNDKNNCKSNDEFRRNFE